MVLPIRSLGSVGVVTDLDPFNLPISGFTRAKNVRFTQEGNIERAPVYRDVSGSMTLDGEPAFVFGLFNSGGYDKVLVVTDLFHVYEYSNNTLTSNVDFGASSSLSPFTGTVLGDVEYLNRPDRVPVFRAPNRTTFADLTNWPATYRCVSLRSYGDFLIGLNMTEGASSFPNRVRWSNLAQANSVPDSWDAADTTKSAGFNDLIQMETPIVDGLSLGTNFVVYSSDSVWNMEFVGGTFIFNFRKIFDNCGVINQNCVVEVGGRHYVFDADDIYVHDGVTRNSICAGRVRDYIFSGLDMSKAGLCYVQHNPELEEIYFCYHTGDDMHTLPDCSHCNRAAIYNYAADTWSFLDLPNTVSGTTANINTVSTWAAAGNLTWENAGGSWHDQESQFARHSIVLSKSSGTDLTTDRILVFDGATEGSVAKPLAADATQDIFLERKGIDLDEVGMPLAGYKVLKGFVPQISTRDASTSMQFTFGASDLPSGVPGYGSAITFDTATDYKVDTRIAGRYLSYKVSDTARKDFRFSGMDVDAIVTGRQ